MGFFELFPSQAITSMFAVITSRKVKQLKESRMLLYRLLLWKEIKIPIQEMASTRKHSAVLTETEIIQAGNYGEMRRRHKL